MIESKTHDGKSMVIIVSVLLVIALAVYYFIFNIYDVKISSSQEIIFAGPSTKVKLVLTPINALGWKVPFRKVSGKFEIIEGDFHIDIIHINEDEGYMVFRPKDSEGRVELRIKSKYSLFPLYYKINVLPKTV